MPVFTFEHSHIMTDTNTTTLQNVLMDIDLGRYFVLENSADVWRVQLRDAPQGVVYVEFRPPEGGSFTPGPGSTEPVGEVGRIEFMDASFEVVVAISDVGFLMEEIFDFLMPHRILTSGDDLMLGSPEVDEFLAGEGDDVLEGAGGNDLLDGATGNDRIFGGEGDDELLGSAGDDVLYGGEGDDVQNGGPGADMIVAGPGNDVMWGDFQDGISYAYAPNAVTIRLWGPSGPQDTGWGMDTFIGAWFSLVEGSAFDDWLAGNVGDQVWYGFDGDDLIEGGGGEDEFHGGAGDDVFVLFDGRAEGGDGDDWTIFEFDITGYSTDVVFGGDEAADSGFDVIEYTGVEFYDSLAGVRVRFAEGQTTLHFGDLTEFGLLFTEFEGIEGAFGSYGHDVLIGDSADNLLGGGPGIDWVEGADGDDWLVQGIEHFLSSVDRLFGGAGFDTIDFDGVSAGVVVQLSGYATSGGSTVALFSSIEAASGSAFDDALIGTDDENRLIGGAGSDWIVGRGGADWFVQGTEGGVDRLFGDAGLDTIDYGAAGGPVTVQLNGWSSTGGGGALLATFTGVENAIGSAFNDSLIGSAAANRMTGGPGGDWLVGAGGDDRFVQTVETSGVDRIFGGAPGADSGLDTLDYSASNAGVVVQLSGYATTNDAARTLLATFSGVESVLGTHFNDALIGDGVANEIRGGGGDDWLAGAGGADRLYGGASNDRFLQNLVDSGVDQFFGEDGSDTIDYSQAHAGVIVQLSGYATTNAGAGSVTLATFSSIENAVGSNSNDALIGDAADNVIIGLQGADWLVGGAGADRFVYRSTLDGTDSVRDFSRDEDDRIDLAAIDADASLGGDQAFTFSASRTPGVHGEAVVTTFASSTLVSLHLDSDNIADMTIQVVHQPGLVMNAGDFVL